MKLTGQLVWALCIMSLCVGMGFQTVAATDAAVPLLRDGIYLKAIEGTLEQKAEVPGVYWLKLAETVSDKNVALEKGGWVEMLPTAALEAMVQDHTRHPQARYTVWVRVTQYQGKNYFYAVSYLSWDPPVAEQLAPPHVDASSANPPQIDRLQIPDRYAKKNKKVMRMRTDEPPIVAKPDRLLLDRLGTIELGDNPHFVLSGLGLNKANQRFPIMPGRQLERLVHAQGQNRERLPFKVSGLLTEYHGTTFLLIQRNTRAYNYGNFGK